MMKQMWKGDRMMMISLTLLIYVYKNESILMNFVNHSKNKHRFTPNAIINCWMYVFV
jgi:hypothetical protein